ncbi:MAG: hypothetical protein WAT39_01665, partial [Planctomycetota bacterium]
GALTAMRSACARHRGNLYVHLQAAAMFDRQALFDEGAREHEVARALQPTGKVGAPATAIDLDGLGNFLGDVDRVLRSLEPPREPARTAPGHR